MALNQVSTNIYELCPGLIDVHTHPRAMDSRIQTRDFHPDNAIDLLDGYEGKAGIEGYSAVALQSGMVAMLAMPNESIRLWDVDAAEPNKTTLHPYPISTLEMVQAIQSHVASEAAIEVGIHFGLNPAQLYVDNEKKVIDEVYLFTQFLNVSDEVTSLKLYLEESTGLYNIPPHHASEVIKLWYDTNPGKPVVLHVEGEHVASTLRSISELEDGNDIPIHIAHVSSQEELEAVIEAKKRSMNVTCEATFHHLTLTEHDVRGRGNYGCVKPGLKKAKDVKFIRSNIEWVDVIASDCAPHTKSEKEGTRTNWGLTGHTMMLPALLSILTIEQIYQKMCVRPRQIFNLPIEDNTWTKLELGTAETIDELARREEAHYGYQPYSRIKKEIPLGGKVLSVKAANGSTYFNGEDGPHLRVERSYRNLIRPKNLGGTALSEHDLT